MDNDLRKSRFIIIFRPQNNLPFSFLLKKNFRHCWIYIETNNGWILINPLRNSLFKKHHPKMEFISIMSVYAAIGYNVVCGNRKFIKKHYEINTCVGAAKRLIGLSNFMIQTPYQLFKFLQKGKYL